MAPMPPLKFDLKGFTPYRLAVAAQILSERLAKQYRSQFGITIPEWRVLVNLTQRNDLSVRDIEVHVAMEKSKVSRAASRLEEAGYIAKSRHDGDKRLVKLRLTERGRDLMAELLPMAEAFQKEIEAELGDTFSGFEAGLDRLLGEAE